MASGPGAVRTAHTSSLPPPPTRILAIVFIVVGHFSGKLSKWFSPFLYKRALDAGSALLPLEGKLFDLNAIVVKAEEINVIDCWLLYYRHLMHILSGTLTEVGWNCPVPARLTSWTPSFCNISFVLLVSFKILVALDWAPKSWLKSKHYKD